MAQIGLGADYIGPSVYWACEAGMTAEHIGKFLETARTFGGTLFGHDGLKYQNEKENMVMNS